MAAVVQPAPTQQQEVNPMTMSLDQLSFLKNQQEEDIHELNRFVESIVFESSRKFQLWHKILHSFGLFPRQMEALVGAKNRYLNAKNTVTEMGGKKEGNGQLSFSTKLRHDIFTSIHTPNLHSCIIRMIGFLDL